MLKKFLGIYVRGYLHKKELQKRQLLKLNYYLLCKERSKLIKADAKNRKTISIQALLATLAHKKYPCISMCK